MTTTIIPETSSNLLWYQLLQRGELCSQGHRVERGECHVHGVIISI